MKCINSQCKSDLPIYVRNCVACGCDNGAPNVRAAATKEETDALATRCAKANAEADRRGCRVQLEDFGKAVASSQAVYCCTLAELNRLASADKHLFANFHQLVKAGILVPEDTFDLSRLASDHFLFPGYFEQIYFAALSLDGDGLIGYGPFSIIFKETHIASRTSVFESNSLIYYLANRNLPKIPLPHGLRTTWSNRSELAMAKLASRIHSSMTNRDYPAILLKATFDKINDDFIEVHIYGSLNRHSVSQVRQQGRYKGKKADQVMYREIKRKLKPIGVTVE